MSPPLPHPKQFEQIHLRRDVQRPFRLGVQRAKAHQVLADLAKLDASCLGQPLKRHCLLEPLDLLLGEPRHRQTLPQNPVKCRTTTNRRTEPLAPPSALCYIICSIMSRQFRGWRWDSKAACNTAAQQADSTEAAVPKKAETTGNESFGTRLARLRKAAGYSQRELALEFGTPTG